MRILVTGGAGFIGSHVTDGLLRQGHEVVVLDDLSTGDLGNLDEAMVSGRVKFIHGNVRDRELLPTAFDGVHRVFHLAATVGVKNIVTHPLKSLMNNLDGAAAVLEAATNAGGVKVILFSSSEVYGKGIEGRLSEETGSVLGATSVSRWSYAASKVMDEFMALGYAREKGLPVVIVRCFNTSGPRQVVRSGMVLPRLVSQALAGEPMTVYGDGDQTRCFSYVGDVARGVLMLAEAPDAEGEVFNIGNDQETTILNLARNVKELTESRSEIQLIPYEDVFGKGFEDVQRRVPSLDKIRRVTGFSPKVDLETLLVLAIRDYAACHDIDLPENVLSRPVPDLSMEEPLVPSTTT